MARSRIKRVIVIGAGFSVPADLPVQNKIIEKMIGEPDYDFLSGVLPRESIKFLNAYITVGLFLLDNYGKGDYYDLAKSYAQLNQQKQAIDIFLNPRYFSLDKAARNAILEVAHGFALDDVGYYSALYKYKESIRSLIKKEGISVNLEDIFTSFDKSVITVNIYTNTLIRKWMKSAIQLCGSLYIIFPKACKNILLDKRITHVFGISKLEERKSPTTIITTNWDTLIEEYCEKNNISYHYGLHMPYTNIQDRICKSDILLLKIHGSANWGDVFIVGQFQYSKRVKQQNHCLKIINKKDALFAAKGKHLMRHHFSLKLLPQRC